MTTQVTPPERLTSDAMAPVRVQLSRAKGWRMPENTVKVDRSTLFGNPWTVEEARNAGFAGSDVLLARWVVRLFREYLEGDNRSAARTLGRCAAYPASRLRERFPHLRGKNLACWCALDAPCHADVLLEMANAPICEAVG